MVQVQARLNPEAPVFIPKQLLPLPAFSFPPQHYVFSTTPISGLDPLQTHFVCYNSNLLCSPLLPELASPETALLFDVAKMETNHLGNELEQKKEIGVADSKKGFVKQRFIGAIIGCERRTEGRRRNGYRLQACVWKPKPIDEEKCGGCPTMEISKSGRVVRRVGYLRAFHNNKQQRHPVVPVRFGGEDTTVMIRNIPNKYTREMLVDFLDNYCMVENDQKEKEENKQKNGEGEHAVSAFDFVYLPIDFTTKLNKGYAFVNFTNSKAAWKFHCATNNQKWNLFESKKIREVATARLQGKEKLLRHFETMNFPCESEEFLPVCFSPPRDGVIKREQKTIGRLIGGGNLMGRANEASSRLMQ